MGCAIFLCLYQNHYRDLLLQSLSSSFGKFLNFSRKIPNGKCLMKCLLFVNILISVTS